MLIKQIYSSIAQSTEFEGQVADETITGLSWGNTINPVSSVWARIQVRIQHLKDSFSR